MATYNLGRIGLKTCGEYDANTTYEQLDVVTYNGSSYAAKDTTINVEPTDTERWDLLALGMDQAKLSAVTSGNLYALGIQCGTTDNYLIAKNSYYDVKITFPIPFKEGTVPFCMPAFRTSSVAPAMAGVSIVTYSSITNKEFIVRCYNNTANDREPKILWLAIGEPDPARA